MPQFRQDPLTGCWVSIAPERARRPIDFDQGRREQGEGSCPFCEGHESETPEEVLALRTGGGANAPGWGVRVVANKFPFVGDADGEECAKLDRAFFLCEPATGIHEVVIESPRHLTRVTELTDAELTDVLTVCRDRLAQLRSDGRWKYALAFKNSGEAAGASLEHIHSQLIAVPMVPERIETMLRKSESYYREHGRTYWRDLIQRQREVGERVVIETENFIAICPFASRQPYEMQIIPKQQTAHFSELADNALPELATLLRGLIMRLESVLNPLAFNWMINTCPFDRSADQHYHWNVEIVPRVTKTAGYEWATDWAINAVSPEVAAARLRDAT